MLRQILALEIGGQQLGSETYALFELTRETGGKNTRISIHCFISVCAITQSAEEQHSVIESSPGVLWEGFFQPGFPIVENTWSSIVKVWKVCFCRRQSLLWPSGIWLSSVVAAHERFQLARTLITVILMRHMLISPINEGVWGKTTIYPSSIAHSNGGDRFAYMGFSHMALDPNSTPSWMSLYQRLWKKGKVFEMRFLSFSEFLIAQIWESISEQRRMV